MDIVDEINDRSKSFRYQVSIVVAGMIGDKPGLFDSPGPLGLAITRKCAFAGTGGYVAVAAYRLALKCRPDLAGDDLLSAIVSAAISEDPATGEATYRIDLGERLQEAYLWPPPSIHTPGDR
jgi:20S proteasome alpha/beta subunit